MRYIQRILLAKTAKALAAILIIAAMAFAFCHYAHHLAQDNHTDCVVCEQISNGFMAAALPAFTVLFVLLAFVAPPAARLRAAKAVRLPFGRAPPLPL